MNGKKKIGYFKYTCKSKSGHSDRLVADGGFMTAKRWDSLGNSRLRFIVSFTSVALFRSLHNKHEFVIGIVD